ncbi:salt tolerance down-regulator-domain-containing protein [Mycena capillaripes]|nr:salt tolerance down-regulator-domain-containing protein [Mycena capillaripes]
MGKKRQQQRNGGNQQNAGQVNGVGEDGRRKESLMQKFKGKAGDGDGDGDGDGGLTAAALAATNELLATAKELYRSLGGGSEDDGGDGDDEGDEGDENALGGDAAYWRALPRRLRSGELTDAEFASRVREAAAALVPASTAAKEIISEALSSPDKMPPPPPPPPSSVSIGKKPMAYQQPAPAPPRSARAAAKAPVPAPPPPEPGKGKAAQQAPGTHGAAAANNSNNKIWSTSSSEERERIRDFWLALAEDERRDLVRVEKDTVLRKMKEEQKHSCSCAVCGRKRTAIEDELQVLYDAYYEDLEQYALYQQQYLSSNRTLPPPPGPGPFPGSVEVDRYGAVVAGYPPPTSLASLSPNPNNPNSGNNKGKNRRGRRRMGTAETRRTRRMMGGRR